MNIEGFEGRIREVYETHGGDWYCEVYGTRGAEHNGKYKLEESMEIK